MMYNDIPWSALKQAALFCVISTETGRQGVLPDGMDDFLPKSSQKPIQKPPKIVTVK